ncbi:amidohydrolase family protein [Sphingomonas immobilis]|uniref:Amidohydrolase family protein n=1 Tax=Sphingomonas immobilis TaxID=3063997 RepID=A0ABT8ZYE5_9SPHN|nr:amidohydrolase family protein [Sphingomonas sp. CA1-15]MDO7842030.1 amidohydrolase family protein [Sphingomonas sp. CA1-15]
MAVRRISLVVAAALAGVSSAAVAQTPTSQLLVPPADAETFLIISQAGQHGTTAAWKLPDGTLAYRFSMNLRGQIFEQDETLHIGPNGQPDRVVVRGIDPGGDIAETFDIKDGKAHWKNKIEDATVAYDGKAQYSTYGGPFSALKYSAESLYKASGKTLTLLPGGSAKMVKLVDIPIGSGPTAKTVTSWTIEGVGLEPQPIVLNQDGTLFAYVGGIAMIPEAYKDDFLKIQKAQIDALAARNPAYMAKFGKVSPVPVAFTHVKLFDSVNAKFLPDQTVVTNGKTIAAVGPAGSIKVPANAKVIDGTGKTLSPGIWDAHMHTGSDLQGLMLLSMGETSARNPGADIQPTLLRNARIAKGELLYPTVYSSVLIDGKGPLAAQGGITVSSAEEAVAAVDKAKADGFPGVKFYTSMKPEWLWPAIKEAHKLGLHVHGHIPATLRPKDVIAGGYDEITHINFVIMQALPDSVVNIDNGIERFNGPGKYAKDVDLGAEPMKSLIAEMAAKKITVDPTLSTFESLYVPENGDLSPSYAPFVGTMPPQVERGFREGGFKPPAGVTRADWRASYAKLVALTKALHDAGVPIVAGTDGGGLEIIRELELYVQAGFTTGEALQSATLTPATLVGAGKDTGSITVGKQADLVLVSGDPEAKIGDMRHTDWVMSDGALMNADELRAAAGFSGRPK